MQACKALLEQGVNKGNPCPRPSKENGYCGKHQRNHEYDLLIKENKIPCNDFFRKCNNTVSKNGRCDECKDKYNNKYSKKDGICKRDKCIYGTTNTKYCKKHERDKYYDEEKEKNIKFCDIERGCFNILKEGTVCEKCREKNRVKEAELRKKRNILHEAIEKNKGSIAQICVNCGKDFAKFNTVFNKTSKICLKCKEYDKKQDHLRSDRVRNYMKEHHKNIENFFKNYIEDASKRNYSFNLQYDEFKNLTLSSCYSR
jgi:hypothetical protein